MKYEQNSFTKLDEHNVQYLGKVYKLYSGPLLQGQRNVIGKDSKFYPRAFHNISHPPKKLYAIGNMELLNKPALSIIGARKATPYGLSCAHHFAQLAAEAGIVMSSGGAHGCDSQAHRGALDSKGKTVVFLGGGCDQIYPVSNYRLFQDILDAGGAVVSEQPWSFPALPFTFRERNRLIAGFAYATLIVEAGLPSGTFSTADNALSSGREVLVVPSAITSKTSAGSNRLLYQGAIPVVDDESFGDFLLSRYDVLLMNMKQQTDAKERQDPLLEALRAAPMRLEQILEDVKVPRSYSKDTPSWLRMRLVELESDGLIKRYFDGRYGPAKL